MCSAASLDAAMRKHTSCNNCYSWNTNRTAISKTPFRALPFGVSKYAWRQAKQLRSDGQPDPPMKKAGQAFFVWPVRYEISENVSSPKTTVSTLVFGTMTSARKSTRLEHPAVRTPTNRTNSARILLTMAQLRLIRPRVKR